MFKKFCNSQQIKIIHTSTTQKAAAVESAQFRLKLILSRIKSFNQSSNGAKYLNQAVNIFNNSSTSGLPRDITPNKAGDHIPEVQLFHLRRRSRYAKKLKSKSTKNRLLVGQKIRLARKHYPFARGFHARFNDGIHTIIGVSQTTPELYKVTNQQDSR